MAISTATGDERLRSNVYSGLPESDGMGFQEPCRIGKAAENAGPTSIFRLYDSGGIGALSVCRTRASSNFSSRKVRSNMRRFFFLAEGAQKCRALARLPRDTFGDLSRSFDNQAVLDLVNPLFKLR